MPEAFLPRLLLPLRLALQGGACPLLPLSGPYHDPAFRALRQIQLLATPPVARAVGAALPAVQRLARLESLLHHGLRGGGGLGHAADPAHAGRVELGHVLRAVESAVGDVDAWALPTLPQLLRQRLHCPQQDPFIASVAVQPLEELRDAFT